MRKKPFYNLGALPVIFCIVFIEFACLGMIIPLSPYLARDFGADDLQVGLLMSVYSLAQLVCAPVWGYVSDLFGRKLVILICVFGTCLFYLWFAFSESLEVLFFTRVLSGVFGAVMSLSMACIADKTGRRDRSKNMGLVGAAIGLGFVIGPLLGGMFGALGRILGSHPPFGSSFSAFGAFLLCLINGLLVIFFLKENFQDTADHSKIKSVWLFAKNIFLNFKNKHQMKIKQLIIAIRTPVLKHVLLMYFLLTVALAGIEMSLFLYIKDKFAWSHFSASLGFAYIGCMMAFTQGFLVRKWIPIFGEKNVLLWSLWIAGIGFAGIGFSSLVSILAISITLLCIGYGLSSTSLSGAVSLLTGQHTQGSVLGVHQSVFALARIIGPILGGWLYRDFSHSSPFYLSGLLVMMAWAVGWSVKKYYPETGKTSLH